MLISTLATILALSWIVYYILLGVYRVFYSPLAKFPGPRLAALTTWYQGYYDIWLHGQYFRKISDLHAAYGPIVRINPDELHVDDPEFIDELFAGSGKRRDKDKWMGRSLQLPDSTVGTISHDHHRSRRAALNPYFSKASIRRLEPVITLALDNLLHRLDVSAKNGEVIALTLAYKAATCDIITGYCFGESTGFLMRDDYNSPFFDAHAKYYQLAWWMTHIAWLGPLLNSVPTEVQSIVMPGLTSLFQMQRRWVGQIEEIRSSKSRDDKRETIFHGILNSDLPDEEKTSSRMRQEAQLLVQAGQDTTAQTLTNLTFHLLANPPILKKLREELTTALPNINAHPTLTQLEQLPYLSAIIQEGFRLHPGATLRMQRISPDAPLFYRDPATKQEFVIAAGTSVSMDAISINMNSKIFPEPRRFWPERWIGNSGLEKYLLTFSKGPRICVGINLAYAELYIILAGVFRKYDLDDGSGIQKIPTLALYETDRERDVDLAFDFLVPYPSRESKGVRAMVR